MKESSESARPAGPLSVALRLGCALLACAGIAAGRGALPTDDAASALRQPEQAIAPVLDSVSVQDSTQASPKGTSLRLDRPSIRNSFRLIPFAVSSKASNRAPQCAVAVPPSAVPFIDSGLLPLSSSPRAPPVSA